MQKSLASGDSLLFFPPAWVYFCDNYKFLITKHIYNIHKFIFVYSKMGNNADIPC